MRAALWLALLSATTLVAPAAALRAQSVMIAPNALVIDGGRRTASLTLVNTGERSAEVRISSLYGYPVSDSSGQLRLETFESVDDSAPSAANWIQAYPARLVLRAGARRTVRIVASPPDSIAEREYWSRVVVSTRDLDSGEGSSAQGINLEAVAPDANVGPGRVGLRLEIRSLLGFYYRHGDVRTGVSLGAPTVAVQADSIIARVPMERFGNAAFVGVLRVSLVNASGSVLSSTTLPLGVYYTLAPRIAVARPAELRDGSYSLRVEALSSRPDVASSLLLPIAPVQISVPVELSGR